MKIVGFLAVLLLVVAVVKHTVERYDEDKISSLHERIRQLKIDNQYNEGQAYSDCQRMLQANIKIERTEGCMMAIERLCTARTKQPELCMKTFAPVCGHLEE